MSRGSEKLVYESGRSCADKHGKEIQEGNISPIDVIEIEPKYTTLKKLNKPE